MSHQMYRLRIRPRSPFATPLRGDTLFGMCCQMIAEQSPQQLDHWLDGYLNAQPFLVLSDAFPSSYLPRPALPLHFFGYHSTEITSRKQAIKQHWLPLKDVNQPVSLWNKFLCRDDELLIPGKSTSAPLWQHSIRTHNSINRLTGTTGRGEDGFAPYERGLTWYHPELVMDIYAVLDSRITIDQLKQILTAIGQFGYGKDASTGCGRFEVVDAEQFSTEPAPQANSWLTLAPCAPQNWNDSQGHGWQAQNCFYDVHVRFGKHGAAAGGQSPNHFVPWKNPVLLADTGALLTPVNAQSSLFCGQGLSELSVCHPDTVQQGYSPILPVHFDGIREGCQ